ncbi:MAG: hypothetical protein AVDCRST_MAG70-79 [uncultured Thermomicrobiales bacterium]|uniref:Response regulatory domain-containing protein n=1 Tax=uncultured Thermomicrobiales bacterium TaxID=1645740 RepID=A0A6J4U837_9BACT|nr:MAG: hypothetical protein AVDCRST_MAG70-79 [uncultured Thermomicrobiales bacterium]
MTQVLVVDDELVIREIIATVLRDEGYDVLEASGGRQMVEVLATAHPHLILLDLMMPDGDGQNALHELRSEPSLRDIPVVVMTAGRWSQPLATPVAGIVTKPLDIGDLLTTVARFARPLAP